MKKILLTTMAILTIGSFMSCSSDDDGAVIPTDGEGQGTDTVLSLFF
jgi:hypothetical protein